jgi:hypothetical protein
LRVFTSTFTYTTLPSYSSRIYPSSAVLIIKLKTTATTTTITSLPPPVDHHHTTTTTLNMPPQRDTSREQSQEDVPAPSGATQIKVEPVDEEVTPEKDERPEMRMEVYLNQEGKWILRMFRPRPSIEQA